MIEKKTKKRRTSIQELPEDVLIKIISLLEMKEAIRTSIVSRKWRHLWKDIPNLFLDAYNMLSADTNEKLHTLLKITWSYYPHFRPLAAEALGRKIIAKFINNVDTILRNHHGTGVKHLTISFHLDGREHGHYLDRWISFAVMSRIKELALHMDLSGYGRVRYNFPFHLFSSERGCYLEDLELSWCSIESYQNFDGFRNLKKLILNSVGATSKAIQNFLSKCVALKILEINKCDELVGLEIPSPLCTLEVLKIWACANVTKIDFCAPSLSVLYYCGKQVPLIFQGALLLEEASMHLSSPPSLICVINQLHHDLPYLKTLQLDLTFKVCHSLESQTQLINLKHLKLTLSRKIIRVASSFVKASPFLETFTFHLIGARYVLHNKKIRTPPECHHNYLKTFEMTGFTGRRRELDLLSFILTNATQLEVMIVEPGKGCRAEDARKLFNKKLSREVPGHVNLVLL